MSEGSLYLQIYPSSLVNASRMMKIGSSVQRVRATGSTHLVGIGLEGRPQREEVSENVFIVRIRGGRAQGNLARVLRVLLWQPLVFRRYRRETISVVAAHNVWVLPLCWVLCRQTGASLIYNAHELETETIAMQGLKQTASRLIERLLIQSCVVVSVVNGSIADWYESKYPISRPIVVGNVPVTTEVETGLRKSIGVSSDKMLYIHTGNLVHGRNIPLILDAFSRSPHHVVFLGEGHLGGRVRETAKGSSNVHWLAPVHPDLLVAHVREADVGLCLIERQVSLSYQFSSPNKLMETLAAGIPALCTDLVEARRVLGPLAHGWILEDPTADLSAALERITKVEVNAFRDAWGGVDSWEREASPLVEAVAALFPEDAPTTAGQPQSEDTKW